MTIARVRTVFTGVAGAPWYSNLFFFDDGGTPTAAAATAAVQQFWFSLKTTMLQGTTIGVEADVPQINEATGKIIAMTVGTASSQVGGPEVEPLPFATQGLIRWETAAFVNGRNVRGKTFIPSQVEANNFNGNPASGLLLGYNNAANALRAAMPNLCVWSRPFAGTPSNPTPRAGTAHLVTSESAWSKWAVLRSRRD